MPNSLPGILAIAGLREIEITAKLVHPNILALYDCREAQRLLYYVMPYVEGESLRDRLIRETQLPIADTDSSRQVLEDGVRLCAS
ncbi:MAG: protein kinase domain-containing protein [Planctomycetota bacterium]